MNEIPLVMPKMSMTMTEGIFVAWHKQEGDEVRSGDVVAEVTTDKVDMEVESPVDGVLARLVAEPEDVIPVGEPIAFLTSDNEDLLGDLLGGDDDTDAAAAAEADDADADADTPADAAPADAAGDADGDAATGDAGAAAADDADEALGADTADGAAAGGDADDDAATETGDVTSRPDDVAPVDSPQVETPPTTQADPPADSSRETSSPQPSRPSSTTSPSSRPSSPEDNGWVASVPLARTRATELGVDLGSVEATGPGGVVRVVDVERAAAPPESEPHRRPDAGAATTTAVRPAGDDASVVRRRAALAKRMTESAAVPQFVVFRDLDLDDLAAARDGVSWTAVLLAAYAAVLRDDPVLHARWAGERRQPHDEVVVSVAVDTPDGLLAPSLAAPDRMPLREVDESLRALAARAREGRLSVADLTPGTTTVSNLGGLGVDAFTVLLTPPQATALSLGAVGPVPVAVPGGLGVRVRCRAGLAVDHRVADGADAARLLQRLQARCADPSSLGL